MTGKNANTKAYQALVIIAGLSFVAYVVAYITRLLEFLTLSASDAQVATINIVCVALPLLIFLIARGVRARNELARTFAVFFAIVLLAGFPVGTIIGIYLLFQLFLCWEPANSAATNL